MHDKIVVKSKEMINVRNLSSYTNKMSYSDLTWNNSDYPWKIMHEHIINLYTVLFYWNNTHGQRVYVNLEVLYRNKLLIFLLDHSFKCSWKCKKTSFGSANWILLLGTRWGPEIKDYHIQKNRSAQLWIALNALTNFFFSHFIFSIVIFFIAELFVCYSGPSFSHAENSLGCDFKRRLQN